MIELLKLAVPISLANIVGIIAILLNTKIVGDISSYNLYLLTLFMPFNFWVVSLFESFRVPATSVATYAYSRGEFNLIGSQIGCLLFISLIGILIPFSVAIISPNAVSSLLSIHNAHDLNQFSLFTAYMLPASYLLSAFFIVSSTLNGIGKQHFAMVITMMGVLFGTLLNLYLTKNTRLEILSMPVSSIVTYLVLLTYTFIILFRSKILTINSFKQSLSLNNLKIIKRLALPVWVAYIFITLGIVFFNYILSPYGHDVVSGFGIAYRIQSVLLLPAISLGIAVGILINKNRDSKNNKLILRKGMLICVVIYTIISFGMYYKKDYCIGLITTDPNLIQSAIQYFKIVSLTYIGLSISLCYCLVLEQTGYGIQSTCFSATIFLIEIFIALILIRYWHKPDALYWAIAIGNIICGLATLCFFKFNTSCQFIPRFIKHNK